MVRPENELIINLVRTCDTNLIAEAAAALIPRVTDWDYFLRMAQGHQIRPLVLSRLKHLGPRAIPEEVFGNLNYFYPRNAIHNLQLMGELVKLLTLFKRQGIPALSYKGPVQAVAIYGNLTLREIADLDILVPQEEILNVKRLMLENGYLPKKVFTPAEEQAHLTGHTHYEYPFIKENGELVVEIHWNVLPEHSTFKLSPESLWEDIVTIEQGGVALNTFAPEEVFLLLCIHNEHHNWRVLKFIVDAAFMLAAQSETLDWDRVLGKAQQLDRIDTVLLTVYLASRLLAAPVPPLIATMIEKRRGLPMLAGLSRTMLFRQGFNLPGFLEWFEAVGQLRGQSLPSNMKHRIQYFPWYVWALLTPEVFDRTLFPPLPRYLSFLYCITRVLRYTSNKIGVHLPKKNFPSPDLKSKAP